MLLCGKAGFCRTAEGALRYLLAKQEKVALRGAGGQW